ncbi:YbaN family protein [Minwuia sp.]|uniref:YbaN family protein n=1 Tax=Minwuia sp. TaxID=2493630 RepID=UPI003A94F903
MPRKPLRWLLLFLGWVCVGLGIAGIILPGLPGVPFLLLAAWAFSRSSKRFHDWLMAHPRLGTPVRAWQRYRAVPRTAKIAAVVVMSGSFGLLLWMRGPESPLPWIAGGTMAIVAIWLVSRPDLEEVRALETGGDETAGQPDP